MYGWFGATRDTRASTGDRPWTLARNAGTSRRVSSLGWLRTIQGRRTARYTAAARRTAAIAGRVRPGRASRVKGRVRRRAPGSAPRGRSPRLDDPIEDSVTHGEMGDLHLAVRVRGGVEVQ